MRTGILVALVGTVVLAPVVSAQGGGTAASPKKAVAGKTKTLLGQIADTAITSAASVATDTVLGEHAGMVAAVLGADGAPSCPPGLMALPAQYLSPSGTAGMPGVPSAGSAIVGMAKGKLGGKKAVAAEAAGAVAGSAGNAVSAGGAPSYVCGTPDQITAAVQAAQGAGAADGAGGSGIAGAAATAASMSGAMKYTPLGAAVSAAPMAGAAAKKVGGLLGRGGQSAESMAKDLGKGRLVVQKIKFVEGGNELAPGFEEELGKLTQALASTDGQFVVRVPVEASGDAEAAGDLARARTARVHAHLLLNGVPAARLTRGEPGEKPAKKGDARVELVIAAGSDQ